MNEITGGSALSAIACPGCCVGEQGGDHTLDVVRICLDVRLEAVLAQALAGDGPDRDDARLRGELHAGLAGGIEEETHGGGGGEGDVVDLAHRLERLWRERLGDGLIER